jgi:hypothetical protein
MSGLRGDRDPKPRTTHVTYNRLLRRLGIYNVKFVAQGSNAKLDAIAPNPTPAATPLQGRSILTLPWLFSSLAGPA